jgi:2-methylcitrate dehydratase PrpD
MTSPTLSARLIQLVNDKPVTEEDLAQAALFVLDTLASVIAGRASKVGAMLCQWADQAAKDAGRLAFLMGSLAHILEVDDLHRASVVHPGCVVVPAAWAAAEREGANGKELLTAVLHGYEAVTRIGMAVGPAHYRIWHNTATCGPFGAALAAAYLTKLDATATQHALGNAGTQAAGLWQFLETGAMTKHLHAGRAAEAGILANDLARLGFTGPPAILEGAKGFFAATCPDADPDAVIRDLAHTPWQLRQTSLKPWPSCRHTHPTIDAAQALRRQIDPYAIDHILVETYQTALDVCDRPDPQSDYHAKFSLQHCVAAALLQNHMDFSSFQASARSTLTEYRTRVTLRAEESYCRAYPTAWGSAVTVTQKHGGQFTVHRSHAKGDPENPLTAEEIVAKAHQLFDHAKFSHGNELVSSILRLVEGGPIPAIHLFC